MNLTNRFYLVCPGMRLARQEAILTIAWLVRMFDFSLNCPAEEVEEAMNLTVSATKLPVRITRRKDV